MSRNELCPYMTKSIENTGKILCTFQLECGCHCAEFVDKMSLLLYIEIRES